MEKAQAIVFVKYQGLTVEEDTMLRKELREAGVEYKVYKNTLSTIAAKNLGYESCVNLLEGPVSVAFGYDDVTAPARVLNDFAKKNKNLELKGGIIDGELYDVDKIKNRINTIKRYSYRKTTWKFQSSSIKFCIFN